MKAWVIAGRTPGSSRLGMARRQHLVDVDGVVLALVGVLLDVAVAALG